MPEEWFKVSGSAAEKYLMAQRSAMHSEYRIVPKGGPSEISESAFQRSLRKLYEKSSASKHKNAFKERVFESTRLGFVWAEGGEDFDGALDEGGAFLVEQVFFASLLALFWVRKVES